MTIFLQFHFGRCDSAFCLVGLISSEAAQQCMWVSILNTMLLIYRKK
jgi:hypothetical protein